MNLELRKCWKLLMEIILIRLDDNLDGLREIYHYRNNDKVRYILDNPQLSITNKRYKIFVLEFENYRSLIKKLYGEKLIVKYLNIQDPLSGRTLLDISKNGIFGMNGGVTYFVSGDWKVDKKIYNFLVSNMVVSNLRRTKIKSMTNKKYSGKKSLKKRS